MTLISHRVVQNMLFGIISLLFALPLFLGEAYAQDEIHITWPYFSYPPFVVLDEDRSPSGLYWNVRTRLWERMPSHEHSVVESPFTRSMLSVREGEHYCFTGLLKTPEREAELVYSRPFSLGMPHVAVCRKGELDAFKEHGAVSLARLLHAGKVLGYVDGLSHGPRLDPVLAPYVDPEKTAKNVQVVRRMNPMTMQFNLVRAGRTDFFISNGFQATYEYRRNGGEGLEFIPIVEDPEPFAVHVACTGGEWGEHVIREVDVALAEIMSDPDYVEMFLGALDEPMRTHFRTAFERLMVSGEPPAEP